MAITESHRALGSWSLALSPTTPRTVLDALQHFGHVSIHTGRVEPALVGDGLLASSEYTGVLREKTFGDDWHDIGGPGMAFWLGDEDGKGSVYETAVTFAGELPTQAVRDLLPASGAVTEGSFHPVAGLYSGTHQWESPRSAIDYVCTTMDAEWRVNGDGTLDFGSTEDLFVTNPTCIVVRCGAGVDMDLKALQGKASTMIDTEDFTTRVVLLAMGTEAATATADVDINPALNPYKDLHGNPVALTRLVSESTTDASNAPARAQLQLNRFSGTRDALTLSAKDYDVFGAARAGDYVWVFDPDIGLFDLDNEITFRGERLYPAKLRLTEVTWPVQGPGRTVSYRAPDGTWLDLTDYVLWETGDASLKVGGYSRSLITSGEVVGSRPVADTSVPAVTEWVEPFLLSTYQSPTTGVARGAAVLAWTRPLNTDGTTILDGSHYEIRYRTSATAVYPATWDDLEALGMTWGEWEATGATWGNPLAGIYEQGDWQYATAGFDQLTFHLQELVPANPYEVQIRAVDMATPPNFGAWSDPALFQTTRDNQPPVTPAAPTIAASTLAVQMVHELGAASGGTFNLDRDLHHLELHGGPEPLFTPDDTTLLGKVLANWGMISGQIPLVATFPLDNLSPVYFKVIAVDEAGNKSLPSPAKVATAELVDDAHISSLTVSKVTAGTISADWLMAGSIKTGAAGARTEQDIEGIRLYNASNQETANFDAETGDVSIVGTFSSGLATDPQRIVINPTPTELSRIDMFDNGSTDHTTLVNFGGNYLQQRERNSDRASNGGRILWQSGTSYFGHQDASNDAYLSFSGQAIALKGHFQQSNHIGGLTAVYTRTVGGSGTSASISYGATMVGTVAPFAEILPTSGGFTDGQVVSGSGSGVSPAKGHCLNASTATGVGIQYSAGNCAILLWAVRIG